MLESSTATFINEKGVLHYKAGEIKQAIVCWEKAANLGNSSAMFGLGVIYLNDRSLENNLYKAREWFEKAVKAGHKNAIIQLKKIGVLELQLKSKSSETYLGEEDHELGNKMGKSYKIDKETIRFGNYEWIIIDQQDSRALCITKDIIDVRRYDEELKNVTWETCTIRKWLNNKFLREFSLVEQDRILNTTLRNGDNPIYGTLGGIETQDKIFLLSIDEIIKYFGGNKDIEYVEKVDLLENSFEDEVRKAYINMTDRQLDEAKKRYGLDYSKINGQSFGWWLRSPGWEGNCAMRINCNGTIRVHGRPVNRNLVGVRPALWLNVNKGGEL